MPPEVMTHGRLTAATDVYSFGMLMYELAAGRFAFGSETAAQIFYRVVHLGERPALPEGLQLPAAYAGLMRRCWAAELAERCAELCHPSSLAVERPSTGSL
jgi:serine/threonine protein kinase